MLLIQKPSQEIQACIYKSPEGLWCLIKGSSLHETRLLILHVFIKYLSRCDEIESKTRVASLDLLTVKSAESYERVKWSKVQSASLDKIITS